MKKDHQENLLKSNELMAHIKHVADMAVFHELPNRGRGFVIQLKYIMKF